MDSVAMPARVGPQRLRPGIIATDDLATSDKPPLVLLHPFLLSGEVRQDVAPLSSYHQVFTPSENR